jgi:hypothetical protein
MSSDPNALAGTWKSIIQRADGALLPISVNIQMSPGVIRVVLSSQAGAVDADNVVFTNGVLSCEQTTDGNHYPIQVKMRQDGNVDITVDFGSGQINASVGTRVIDGN